MDGISPHVEPLDKEPSDAAAPATEAPKRELLDAVRAALRERADPVRAAGAQAYMKSTLPSLGVRVPEVRRLALAAAAAHPLTSAGGLRATVLELWRGSTVREERYAAIDLTSLRLVARDQLMLPVYEEIIRTGAWWDFVDGVSHRIGGLLQAHRPVMTELLLAWSRDQDFWIRRSAITSQLKAKARTDQDLLRAVIEPNLADPEFFIRKAIGWALREYAKSDPEWVRNFVVDKGTRLSPLSRKEALRHLDQGTTPGVTGAG
ncbi:DNA alkylation repair protein [Pseudarthrobacter psychrotolerans]|uniref:DNA alkylation repair protein n=1 Tax=Pseudarthrobacter psychrotolerans TaxID=2697569 RepID=A0A6P1NK36_9MICC|nr:DNA alkylation repair protein [Pseudarthrobacter psychrotolerans]QHK19403.1 DNA alkylation repair protein [Pseudarthrobacter psychrotolerans]